MVEHLLSHPSIPVPFLWYSIHDELCLFYCGFAPTSARFQSLAFLCRKRDAFHSYAKERYKSDITLHEWISISSVFLSMFNSIIWYPFIFYIILNIFSVDLNCSVSAVVNISFFYKSNMWVSNWRRELERGTHSIISPSELETEMWELEKKKKYVQTF